MAPRANLRTGGQLLVDCLKLHGVDTVFCVPGESYLAALDALYDAKDAIRVVVCRQEGGAANMADAYGKLTGTPGVCMVTRGPGAANASIGVHTAMQDSTPMILLVGQVARDMIHREAFQEVDFRQMYAPLAKWVVQIDDPGRIPEIISHAFHLAMAGRPGPVVVAVPEDMLVETTEAALGDRYKVIRPYPNPRDLAEMRAMLAAAERPIMVVGGGGWGAQVQVDMMAFAEQNDLPTGVSFRCQDYFDNRHRCYVGDVGIGINPKLGERVKSADLLVVVGPRLGEITTGGYSLVVPPRPKQRLIHVHAGAEELGRVYQADLPINAGMAEFAAAARALEPIENPTWAAWRADARADYEAALEPPAQPGALDMGQVVKVLGRRLPEDAIVTNGAGNYSQWCHKFFQYKGYRSQLAPTSGAMGYGVPSAVAAKVVHPDRVVVSMNGDGCFMMCGQELATAVQHGLDPIFLIVNNGMYGTIRMHQERAYPTRVIATDLVNPDFVKYAEAFGAHGELVERTEDFEPALDRALAAGRAAVVELRVDPESLSPRITLSGLRAAALARHREE